MVKVNWFVGVNDVGSVSVETEFGMIECLVEVSGDGNQLPDEGCDEVGIWCKLVFVRSGFNCHTLSHDGNDVVVGSISDVVGEESSVTVWLHPEDVGVAWVKDESLNGQVAVSSIEPESSVVNGVWISGVLILGVTSVDLDVPCVLVPRVGVGPFDVLCRVLTFELEFGDNATLSGTLAESSLEEASGADVVAAVKLIGVEHVVLFTSHTGSITFTLITVSFAVTTGLGVSVIPLVILTHT